MKPLASAIIIASYAFNSAYAFQMLDDSSLEVTLRNYYSYQKTHDGNIFQIKKSWGTEGVPDRTTWVQAARVDFASGYSTGIIGIAFDASIFAATPLERGHGAIANGSDRTLTDSNGDAVPEWSKLAIADARIKIPEATITIGRFAVSNPILRSRQNRVLPSTFDGISLKTDEREWIEVEAGYFNNAVPRIGTSARDFTSLYGTQSGKGGAISYLGGKFNINKTTHSSLYISEFEDIWERYYLGLAHEKFFPGNFSLNFELNLYHTTDEGKAYLGTIDNTLLGSDLTLKNGGHSIKIGYQKIFGDQYFDYQTESYPNFTNSLFSDFNGPNEKSIQLRYDFNFAAIGLPGLSAGIWHARGWGIKGGNSQSETTNAIGYNTQNLDNAKHREVGIVASYVIQSGRLKGASMLLGAFRHRANGSQIDGNNDEYVVVTEYPIDIF